MRATTPVKLVRLILLVPFVNVLLFRGEPLFNAVWFFALLAEVRWLEAEVTKWRNGRGVGR